jgi:8-oxo-dGTP pyrophosphatase MutT (NUDIX family)
MERKNGPWTVKGTSRKYRNDLFEMCEDRVTQPDGEAGTYGTVKMKAGVSVIAVDDDGFAYLTRQFRYALGMDSTEVICGAVEENESPLGTAKREAKGEAGITAGHWIDLGYIDLDTSIVNCRSSLFIAKGLKVTEASPEGVETLKRVKVTLSEAVQMVMDCQITHAPSCTLILKAHKILKEGFGNPAGTS